ncbi:MAG: gamma-glutamylcyclotransferase [Victivallaceae bacterium]|nr:gamma-glutamylcyclotransferase [Victivallaceae bacterium]
MIDFIGFYYGTLKKGFHNHHYCCRAKSIEPAVVCGKLYQLPPGYPALQVPNESIHWEGTKDAFADAQEQELENNSDDCEFKIHAGWNTVHGELVTFPDPERDVPPIDQLEGTPFYYHRVLVPARKADGSVIAAWVYVMDDIHFSARYLPNGIWPEELLRKRKSVHYSGS